MLSIYVLFRNILSVLNVLLYILLIPPAIALCILNILFGKQRLRSAAEAGDADAQFRLGVCFMCGRGFARDAVHRFPRDAVRAEGWLRKAAEQGHRKARMWLVIIHARGLSLKQAAQWYQECADRGYAEAQYLLGCCYRDGTGVPQDYARAADWFLKAAEQNDWRAAKLLSEWYEYGTGVPRDHEKAAFWADKAGSDELYSIHHDRFPPYFPGHDERSQGDSYLEGDCRLLNAARAVRSYREAAELGDVTACLRLGECCYFGEGTQRNAHEAADWFLQAAERGDGTARIRLGQCFARGRGVQRNDELAARWFRRAADQMLARGEYFFGLCCLKGMGTARDEAQAVKWLRRSADRACNRARNALGLCHALGRGVPRNDKEAADWFAKAQYDNVPARYNLALCYFLGMGRPRDEASAAQKLREIVGTKLVVDRYLPVSAEQEELAAAQHALAYCFCFGRGLPQSDRLAVIWCRKTTIQGTRTDQDGLLGLFPFARNDIPQSESPDVTACRTAAMQGDAAEQVRMGLCCRYGLGRERDDAQAADWFRKAAGQGHAGANYHLALCHIEGTGVPRDEAQALQRLRKAAELGNAEAASLLEEHRRQGSLTGALHKRFPPLDTRPVSVLLEAADQGDAEAMFRLGECCRRGEGMPQDDEMAADWYHMAALRGHAAAQFRFGTFHHWDETALFWYRQAARADQVDALRALGQYYSLTDERRREASPREAVRWFTRAARKGDALSQTGLGLLYLDDTFPRRPKLGAQWLLKAAEQDEVMAQHRLGLLYLEGKGVPKNAEQAAFWLGKAAEQGHRQAQDALSAMRQE